MGVWNQVAQYLYLKKKDPNTAGHSSTAVIYGAAFYQYIW